MTVYGDESLAEAIAGPCLLRWKSIGNGSEKSILSQEPKPHNYILALTLDIENTILET